MIFIKVLKVIFVSFDLLKTLEISNNKLCIQESFKIYISQKLFDYKITFVNSQYKNNLKRSFCTPICLKRSFLRFLLYKNKSELKYMYHSLNLCSCVVNSQRFFFCIQKAVLLSGIQIYS